MYSDLIGDDRGFHCLLNVRCKSLMTLVFQLASPELSCCDLSHVLEYEALAITEVDGSKFMRYYTLWHGFYCDAFQCAPSKLLATRNRMCIFYRCMVGNWDAWISQTACRRHVAVVCWCSFFDLASFILFS